MRGCRPYSKEEYSLLIQLSDPRERCLIILGVRTGFRISELLSLNVEDVLGDFVYLKKSNTKGKIEGRKIPLHPEARLAIKRFVVDKTSGPLFLNRYGKRLGRISAWSAISNMHKRCGINEEGIATHSMRKTFARNIYAALDNNVVKLQQALGHKSLDSTVKYIGIDSEEISEAIRSVK